jgi:hypothetical protein
MKIWTKPYCGVQHLSDTKPYQVTVEERETFTHLFVVNLTNRPFTNFLVDRNFDTAAEARAFGERWAKKLGV